MLKKIASFFGINRNAPTYADKILFLEKTAYRCFLDNYLQEVINNKKVDFHPALYECGLILHYKAQAQALEVIDNAVKSDKIDELYTRRMDEVKNYKWLNQKQNKML